MRLLISTVSVSFLALSGLVYAQGTSASYPCESPEVKTALETDLSQDELVKLPTVERLQRLQRAVDSLLAKYPRDYLVYQEQTTLAYLQPDAAAAVKALREHWEKEAEAHPDDPIMLTEAAALIADQDPAKAINLLNTAKTKAPGMPWSSFELANIYSAGRRYSDQARMKETLERFYTLCPAWVSDTYFGNQMEAAKLRSDPPLLAKTATALRADLATESVPTRLKDYQVLWQREFLVRAPAEQAQERAQIQADLERLEKMVPNGDGDWRLFLIAGHKLAGASNQELQQMQQQAAHDFPHQAPAEQWEAEQWQQAHPQPEGQKDAAAWKAYYAAEVEHMKMLIREYPDDAFAQRTEFFAIVRDDEYVSEEDGLAAVNRLLDAMHTYGGYGILSFGSMDVPRFLLQHGWEPERALELLKDTQTHKGGGHTQEQPWAASLDDETRKRFRRQAMSEDLEEIGLFLKAAQLAGKPEEALRLREVVEGPPPANEQDLTRYWLNRARFAELDHHPADALVYYHTALEERTEQPAYSHGQLKDELTDEFHTAWRQQGGTETAWAQWNPAQVPATGAAQHGAAWPASAANIVTKATPAPPPGATPAASPRKKAFAAKAAPEGDWKKVSEKMMAIDLSDFSGRQWHQKDFAGKTVVIVSWATWCGPCRLQDAQLEKFYEKMKARKDLTILGMNVDENPGEVRPFMQKHGYTFPVLEGASYKQALDLVPRTWIIDKQGSWRYVRDGFDDEKTYVEFEADLLAQLRKVNGEH